MATGLFDHLNGRFNERDLDRRTIELERRLIEPALVGTPHSYENVVGMGYVDIEEDVPLADGTRGPLLETRLFLTARGNHGLERRDRRYNGLPITGSLSIDGYRDSVAQRMSGTSPEIVDLGGMTVDGEPGLSELPHILLMYVPNDVRARIGDGSPESNLMMGRYHSECAHLSKLV
jgi:hypothetical protein